MKLSHEVRALVVAAAVFVVVVLIGLALQTRQCSKRSGAMVWSKPRQQLICTVP